MTALQCDLWDVAAKRTKAEKVRDQLTRCLDAEAAERLAETPRFRRCLVCLGREDTTAPHAHRHAA